MNDLLLKFKDSSKDEFLEFLNSSPFDDLVEVDLMNDRCKNISHVEGKYFVPILTATYFDLYRYSVDYMVHPEDKSVYIELMDPDTIKNRLDSSPFPGVLSAQFRYRLANSEWRWVEQVVIAGWHFGFGEGTTRFYVFDIQSKKDRELGTSAGTNKDKTIRNELTGLLMTADFFAQAQCLVKSIVGEWCFIAIDLEQFKLYNEWYGRETGDILLSSIGALLTRAEEHTGGLAGYLGQDDFALMAPYDPDKIKQLYRDIHKLVVEKGNSVGFQPAFGVCMIDENTALMDLLDHASQATAYAKSDYRNRIRFFHQEMYSRTERDYRLLSEFQEALHTGKVFFNLQPQIRASSSRVVGAEALARWRRSDGSFVSPAEFIPALEKYGFISDLDEYIWEEVCKFQKSRRAAGKVTLPISVNVSQIDILTLDVPAIIENLVIKYGIPTSDIKVEITESAIAENTNIVKDTVEKLRRKGFAVLMDDFGSGYSSLNMLHTLKVDVIKIDAQFLRLDGDTERKGINILESVVTMTQNMAIPLIIEGVETKDQVDFLAQTGCRYMQGYYFYRPMPVAEFEKLLEDPSVIDESGFIFKPNKQFKIREFLDQNIYSDAMLNSILGAVAIYSKSGENVDIVRFNEQFYELVNVETFTSRLKDIQQFVPSYDLEAFYALFDRAMHSNMNGAAATIHFLKPDGTYSYFLLQMFYIGEESGNDRFYGAVHDMTRLNNLDTELTLLSKYVPECVLFKYKKEAGKTMQVVLNGLEPVLGMTKEEIQVEIDKAEFHKRIKSEDWGIFNAAFEAGERKKPTTVTMHIQNADGEYVESAVTVKSISDPDVDVEYIIIFRCE